MWEEGLIVLLRSAIRGLLLHFGLLFSSSHVVHDYMQSMDSKKSDFFYTKY